MKRASFALLFIFLGLCGIIIEASQDRVLLRDVTALTLYKGQMTTGRRSSPVPQVRCVGGSAKGQFEPKVVQCTNAGFDGSDVQWKCTAEMPHDLEFGKITVSCEGYNYPEDPYILKGSCGLEYELEYRSGAGKGSDGSYVEKRSKEDGWLNFIATTVVILFVAYILYTTCIGGDNHRDGTGFGSRGGYDGRPPGYPGSGPDQGPPPGPPPSYDDTFGNKTNYSETTMGFGGGGRPRHDAAGGQGQGFGGFWTGAGLGGLAGYLYGRSTAQGGQQGMPRHRNTRFDEDTGFSSSHADRPSTSGLRQSTGYGGTSRR